MPAASIVLASASPRRKELLERAGFSVKPVPASMDEEPIAGETPIGYTKRLAREKEEAKRQAHEEALTLAEKQS